VSSAILAAIIFSLRRPKLKKKAVMFLLGMAALLLLNLARVYIVLLAGMKYGIYAADILHILSWFAMAAFIIAIWMVATKKMARVKSYSELL
jgi:exosortase/archaeosortase family protein